MKRNWDISELIEQWTLIPRELALLDNKDTSSHLGFAVWLKFFQIEGHFPNSSQEIPKVAIRYIAQQLRTDPEGYNNYDWQGRLGRYHRTQILKFYGFRRPRATNIDQLIQWLHQNILPQTLDLKSVKNTASEWFRSLCLTPPPEKRFERTIRSAIRTYEAEFCAAIFTKLSPASCTAMDQLLESHEGEESTSNEEQAKELKASLFRFLNNAPGATNLDSLVQEITKLKCLHQMGLPEDLFSSNSLKIVTTYRNRAATAQSWELRRHPESIRYTLLAAFCWQQSQEVTDNLVELLIQLVHKLSSKAERRVTKELIQDFKRVSGKTQLLYHLAKAALNNPEGKIQDVIYPIASPERLQQLIREFESTGASYRQKVHIVTCRSYKHYYRRMVPQILEMLQFRSNNDVHQPVIQGINLLKKYADSRQQYYDSKEIIPLDGVLRSSWRDIFTSTDEEGNERIDRINYEIAVLQALRERLRCKEIWVMGANRYRNPEEDLPIDFEVRREDYYQALQQPTDVKEFISSLTQQMKLSMSDLNEHISSNSKVTLLSKRNGWIKISPLAAQAEPVNLLHLRTELIRRWPMTGLLDILKETDLRVGFTECFQTTAIRETLDRSTLQKRLLLCLYGLGTNTGLKSISNSIPGVSRHELRHIKRRFIHKDQLRQAWFFRIMWRGSKGTFCNHS